MADNKASKPVVVDNGSSLIRVGFAGDDAPLVEVPAVVGGMSYNERYIGNDAITTKRILRHVAYPIEYGIVNNWDDMRRLWHHTFYKELNIKPKNIMYY